jgi:hypothetical protein
MARVVTVATPPTQNSIFTLRPYQLAGGVWVFDDPAVGLRREAFVSGADTMIDRLTEAAGIEGAARGFTLLFSRTRFPGAQVRLRFSQHEAGGTWYRCRELGEAPGLRGWLCSALNLYYPRSPRDLWVQARP